MGTERSELVCRPGPLTIYDHRPLKTYVCEAWIKECDTPGPQYYDYAGRLHETPWDFNEPVDPEKGDPDWLALYGGGIPTHPDPRIETLRREAVRHYNEGALAWRCGQYAKAVRLFERAMESAILMNPKNHHAFRRLGQILQIQDRYEEARDRYSGAIRINPKDAESFSLRAGVEEILGNSRKAVDDAKQARLLDPANGRYEEQVKDLYWLPGTQLLAQQRWGTGWRQESLFSVRIPSRPWETDPDPKLTEPGQMLRYGPFYGLALGIARDGDPSFEPVAGLNAVLEGDPRIFRQKIGAHVFGGYRFQLNGSPDEPVLHGPIFGYGIEYRGVLERGLELGATIALHHELRDPGNVAVAPGVFLEWNPW